MTAPRGLTGAVGPAHADITGALVATLKVLVEQIKTLSDQIADQLGAHTFTSLPRSGTVRAAKLLAEIGDCRSRFPTPESLACLAGVAPSTRQSGPIRSVSFRWSCDKHLREAITGFAADSRRANPWAAELYRRARANKHDTPTPPASWPAHGFTSSGTAGKTASPTTPPNTVPSKHSCTTNPPPNSRPVDTGLLISAFPSSHKRLNAVRASDPTG